MDLLLVVGEVDVPPRLRERARHIVHSSIDGINDSLTDHLRAHLPEKIGVVNSVSTAKALHQSGFKVTLYTDNPVDEELSDIELRPLADPGPRMEVAESVLELIGNTPLLRLARIARDVPPQVLAKIEYLNPGGSVKDRPALIMIEAAEREGKLQPGGTIVEPTSGNTGVGLAIVAARKKYRCIFVVPDKVSEEKISLLRAYGAEVVVCPTAVPPEHPESYYSVSDRLAREIEGAHKLDQYSNPANPLAHEQSTGPEIWRQTAGRITHFVAGVGTAGTIVGTARYLKAQNPNIKVVGADPIGSVYSGGQGRPYLVEGVGEDFFPANFDPTMVDEIISISDQDSFLTARRLTQEEGIFTGGSSGMAVAAALQLGARLGPDDLIVVLLPDSGRGYISKLYNDTWLANYGFIGGRGLSANDVLQNKETLAKNLPQIVHVHPEETVREVVAIMHNHAVSQVVVVNAEPPLVMGEVIGSISEDVLLRQAFADPKVLNQPVGNYMGPVLPTIGIGEPIESIIQRLESSDALLVVNTGHPVGILTRSDLLEFLARD